MGRLSIELYLVKDRVTRIWPERLTARVAGWLPARLRQHVVVYAAVNASDPRRGGPDRGGYAGPDGLTYKDLWEGAAR